MENLEIEKALVMAVAAVAEENGVAPGRVLVRSFREVKKSSLEQFISDNNIQYHKYQLEDSKA